MKAQADANISKVNNEWYKKVVELKENNLYLAAKLEEKNADIKNQKSKIADMEQESTGLKKTSEDRRNKNEELVAIVIKLKEQIKILDKQVAAQSKAIKFPLLSYEAFDSLCKATTGKSFEMGEEYKLDLDLNINGDMELLKLLCKYKLPDGNRIGFRNISKDNDYLKTFLINSFPQSVKTLLFNVSNPIVMDIGIYLPCLQKAVSYVKENFYVFNFEISNSQLSKLLLLSKDITNSIGMCKCTINSTPELEFVPVLDGYKFKDISFNDSGAEDRSDWGIQPDYFENIVKALSKVEGCVDSMQRIVMGECCMEREIVRECLDVHGFADVKIINYSK